MFAEGSRDSGLCPGGLHLPAISVAMPVWNGARFLGAAICSILSQTTSDFELIVSDDGSTDDSLAIARSYAERDPRIVVLTSEHRGIGPAMNRALAVARGEYFAPMDQDDVALPERLQRLQAFLDLNSEVVLVGGGLREIDAGGRHGREKIPPTRPEDVAQAMLTSYAVFHPTSMMRTAALRAIGGYRSGLPFAQDYDLWLRLMERHQIANIPDIVLLKRIHGGAVTQNRSLRHPAAVARATAYLSHLSRVTLGHDFVGAEEPVVTSAARFIVQYLNSHDDLPLEAIDNLSRFLRYAPLLTGASQPSDRPYRGYLGKVLRSGDKNALLRAGWYVSLFFCVNRWRQAALYTRHSGRSSLASRTLARIRCFL